MREEVRGGTERGRGKGNCIQAVIHGRRINKKLYFKEVSLQPSDF